MQELGRNSDSANAFINTAPGTKRFVIGENKQAEDLARHFKISGAIFDGDAGDRMSCSGVPFIRSADVPVGSVVANCSTAISPVEVLRRMNSLGLVVANIGDIISGLKGSIEWPWFVTQQRESVQSRFEEWWRLYKLLDDECSRETLINILAYRLTADISFMFDYKVRLKEQFMEDFMSYRNEVFVDAGGFDGDTTEEFCRNYPDYRRILFFEPSPHNMANARCRLKEFRDIVYFEIGLSDVPGKLKFNPEAGSASAVCNDADTFIVVDALDSLVNDSVSAIKVDLEGWDLTALKGAANTIRKHRPKLAVSVYHAANDFLDIPEYIRSIHPDYKVRLRHYTQGWSESVMFFF